MLIVDNLVNIFKKKTKFLSRFPVLKARNGEGNLFIFINLF